jgi:phosphohistidine phosphatase SixA
MMQRLTAVVAALVLMGCAHAGSSTPVLRAEPEMLVVVVRHAEKATEPVNDPVLSVRGIARAYALDSTLRVMRITDVVVSHLQRTRLTADPFIVRTHALVHVVPIGAAGVAAHVQAVADTVRAITAAAGHGVLVVGHSNTVTAIVQALGGPASAALCDSQYSQLFLVRRVNGKTDAERRTYGAPDPVDVSCAAMQPMP